jgi:hypothetical protein
MALQFDPLSGRKSVPRALHGGVSTKTTAFLYVVTVSFYDPAFAALMFFLPAEYRTLVSLRLRFRKFVLMPGSVVWFMREVLRFDVSHGHCNGGRPSPSVSQSPRVSVIRLTSAHTHAHPHASRALALGLSALYLPPPLPFPTVHSPTGQAQDTDRPARPTDRPIDPRLPW